MTMLPEPSAIKLGLVIDLDICVDPRDLNSKRY